MAEQQNTPEFINDPAGLDEDVQDAVLFGRPQDNSSTATLKHNSVPDMEHNSVPAVEHNEQPSFDYFESSKKLLKSRPDAEYNMRHVKRGPALIFNQYKFEKENPTEESLKERKKEKKLPGDKLKERKEEKKEDKRLGTELDSSAFKEQLKRLGFFVQQHVDYTRAEILDELEELAEQDHSQSDCILIAIFSHGYYNGEIWAHDTTFNLNEILEKFTDVRCPTLKGKPKLFFLQVCQGSGIDLGGKIEEKEEEKVKKKSFEILQHPDFLIAHPSVHGLVSYRRLGYGSWFIQSLSKELAKNGTNLDLLTMLTNVSRDIATHETTDNKAKQVPCITSMLTRIVRFDDKKKPQPGTNH